MKREKSGKMERLSDHGEACCYDSGAYKINDVPHGVICAHLKADEERGIFICDLSGEALCRKEQMTFGGHYRDIWVDPPESGCPNGGRDAIILGTPPAAT